MSEEKYDRSLCGYTVAKITSEIKDLIWSIEAARKHVEAGELEPFKMQRDYINSTGFPTVELLLKLVPVVCGKPKLEQEDLIKMYLDKAKESLEEDAYDIASSLLDSLSSTIYMLFKR